MAPVPEDYEGLTDEEFEAHIASSEQQPGESDTDHARRAAAEDAKARALAETRRAASAPAAEGAEGEESPEATA